ncbi:MAG TPA: hypothetical protein VH120_09830, partial [Gemmataceae bacterium]|nr:hypothetical protein [Gemmataceae bacterium]
MKHAIQAALKPVRARQQAVFVLRCVAAGLLVAAAVGLALGGVRLATGEEVSPGIAVLAIGPLVGLLAGLVVRRGWHSAAAAVDGHYQLKDRTVTALAFADRPAPSEVHALQLADAVSHLKTVEPKAVAPLRAPRGWSVAVTAAVLAAAALLWPLTPKQAEAGPAPAPEAVVAVAQTQKEKLLALEKKLSDTVQDMEDDKADEQKKGLKELVNKLMQKVEEMTQPGTD